MRFAYVVSVFGFRFSVFSSHVLHIYVMISDDPSLFLSVSVLCGVWMRCASARLHVLFALFICAFCMHRHNPVPQF